MTRDQVCRQRIHCLSCPLSLEGSKFCWEYTPSEIDKIMDQFYKLDRKNENIKITSIEELFSYGGEEDNKANTCVCCGTVIPEGRQVCPKCENGGTE